MDARPDKIPRWFASRWAGVAVAALHCGVGFEAVWVAAQPELTGGIDGFQEGASEIACRLDVPPDLAPALVAFAGPMAEARTRGWRVQDVIRRDPQAAGPFRTCLAELALNLTEPAREEMESRISALSGRLFNAPKMWTGVNAVAGALQARRRLTFYEAVYIIDRLERGQTS
jgi:hypothetical protein